MGQAVSAPARFAAQNYSRTIIDDSSSLSISDDEHEILPDPYSSITSPLDRLYDNAAFGDQNNGSATGPSESSITQPSTNGQESPTTNIGAEHTSSPRRGVFSSLAGFRLRSSSSNDYHTSSLNDNPACRHDSDQSRPSNSTASLDPVFSGSNGRRRRRPSSSASDELNNTANSRPRRRHRSSLQRIRDTVMSPFSSSSSATSSASATTSVPTSTPVASPIPDHISASTENTGIPSALTPLLRSATQDSASVLSESTTSVTLNSTRQLPPGNTSTITDLRRNLMAMQEALTRRRSQLTRTTSIPNSRRPRMSSIPTGRTGNDTESPAAEGGFLRSPLAALGFGSGSTDSLPHGGTDGAFPSLPMPTPHSSSENDLESQTEMLSRLLAVAATVTANSLVGNLSRLDSGFSFGRPRPAGPNNQTPESDDSENSFRGFLNRLHNGLLTTELTNSLDERGRTRNFFRMFRFPPSSSTENGGGDNLIPVLIVGVRAVDTQEEGTDAGADTGAVPGGIGGIGSNLFDAISSQPIRMNRPTNQPTSTESVDSGGSGSTGRTRSHDDWSWPSDDTPVPTSRTESVQNMNSSSTGRDSSVLDGIISGLGNVSRDSPARRVLSRSSSVSSLSSSMHEHGHGLSGASESAVPSSEQPQRIRRQERQSWIVYVVGGTYPDDHPILLAPSLFTDDPSYEDLLILETFLGQAKPQVASKEEVDQSGGVLKVGHDISDLEEDKCLVCLGQYEKGEECRKLNECGHIFHRECIDQWLTTGRNSCPLCRTQGVKKPASVSSAPEASTASTGGADEL